MRSSTRTANIRFATALAVDFAGIDDPCHPARGDAARPRAPSPLGLGVQLTVGRAAAETREPDDERVVGR